MVTNATIPNKHVVTSHRQTGLTLLELLVALGISSIVLLGITTLLASSAEARNRVANSRILHEQATLASQILPQQLAQIGYRAVDTSQLRSRIIPVTDPVQKFPAVDGEWESGQTIKADNTSLNFRFSGSSDISNNPDGTIRTCTGASIGIDDIAKVRLFLENNALRCSDGTTNELLIGSADNLLVEQMLIDFGVDATDDERIDSFISSTDATNEDYLNTSLVRIRLLLATKDRAIRFHQKYYFNGATHTATDKRIRQEVVIVVATKN